MAALGRQIDDVLPVVLPPPPERRRIRVDSDLSEVALGRLVGSSGPSGSRWETGSRNPRGEARRRYADVLALLKARLG